MFTFLQMIRGRVPSSAFTVSGWSTRKSRRQLASLVVLSALAGTSLAAAEQPPAPGAAAQLLKAGPEMQSLLRQEGTWEVSATLQATPEAKPMITTGLIAERKMVGPYLQETIQPAPGSPVPDFRRISYLTFNRVEGRWQFVSIDTRFPVGIMPAWSFGKATSEKLTLQFEPIAFVGLGPTVEGKMLRSNLVLTTDGDDHGLAQQFAITSDGSEKEWLFVQYAYTRKH